MRTHKLKVIFEIGIAWYLHGTQQLCIPVIKHYWLIEFNKQEIQPQKITDLNTHKKRTI